MEAPIKIPKEQRTQVAFQTFRRRAAFLPALAYFGGRTLRFKIIQPSVSFLETAIHYSYSPDALDHIMGRQCVGEYESPDAQREEAYAKEFPKSAVLDTLAGLLLGLPVTPLAFVTGFAYTPREDRESVLEKTKK